MSGTAVEERDRGVARVTSRENVAAVEPALGESRRIGMDEAKSGNDANRTDRMIDGAPNGPEQDADGPARRRRAPWWLLIVAVAAVVVAVVAVPVWLLSGSSTEVGGAGGQPAIAPTATPKPVAANCPARPPGPAMDAQNVQPGPLVADGWSAVTVCTKGLGPPAKAALAGARAKQVIDALNGLKPGRQMVCTKEFGGVFQVIVSYPDGQRVTVDGETHGCQQVTSAGKSRLDGKQVGTVIERLVGGDITSGK